MKQLTKTQIANIKAYNNNPMPISAREYDRKITNPWIKDSAHK